MSDLVEEFRIPVGSETSSSTASSPRADSQTDGHVPAVTILPDKPHDVVGHTDEQHHQHGVKGRTKHYNKPSPVTDPHLLSKSFSSSLSAAIPGTGDMSPRRLAALHGTDDLSPRRLATLQHSNATPQHSNATPLHNSATDDSGVRKAGGIPDKPALAHRKSWPTVDVAPRIGPLKSANRARDKIPEDEDDIPTEHLPPPPPPQTDHHPPPAVPRDQPPPPPEQQKEIITAMESECTCTYAVSKAWYKQWEEYVGINSMTNGYLTSSARNAASSTATTDHARTPPTAVEMDTHNDTHNEYIHEEKWKKFISWFGLSHTHQLDRKHVYFKDEKPFDICVLSPFSGLLEHCNKKFNRFEEIGYIECQLRRVLQVPSSRRSRLWISEKTHTPRFRQLPLRFRMLNDCIHRDKLYILAIEYTTCTGVWPTGEPNEPKGDLTKYRDVIGEVVTSGEAGDSHSTASDSSADVQQGGEKANHLDTYPKLNDHSNVPDQQLLAGNKWQSVIEDKIAELKDKVSDCITVATASVLHQVCHTAEIRETELDREKKTLSEQLEHLQAKEDFLDNKNRDLMKQEKSLKVDEELLNQDREVLESEREQFSAEVEQIKKLHAINATRIKLDVGGSTYTTSIYTITKPQQHSNSDEPSVLAAMFSGKHKLQPEPDGSYFIDRDGTHFRHILNFLRDGELDLDGRTPSGIATLRELLREAKYYKLHDLVQWVGTKLDLQPL